MKSCGEEQFIVAYSENKNKISVLGYGGGLLPFKYQNSIMCQRKKECFHIVVCFLVSLGMYVQESRGCLDSLSKV